jgi:membrane protease YdiL (CAAX protease family)
VNIGGEEILWRGYALPLQEQAFGKHAWIVNGLCWNLLIHAFMWWNYIVLMPISLAIPYLVQRYRNTWLGIYIHGFGNLLVLAVLIPSIAGWT